MATFCERRASAAVMAEIHRPMNSGVASTLVRFGLPAGNRAPVGETPLPTGRSGAVACCFPNSLFGKLDELVSLATHPSMGTVITLARCRSLFACRNEFQVKSFCCV